ncbi:hypothetical protein BDR03DRAFT_721372 [Suillus americanus]|nr:hypothetical protein BDR03DRAFT_721372 [Suillus americanus]
MSSACPMINSLLSFHTTVTVSARLRLSDHLKDSLIVHSILALDPGQRVTARRTNPRCTCPISDHSELYCAYFPLKTLRIRAKLILIVLDVIHYVYSVAYGPHTNNHISLSERYFTLQNPSNRILRLFGCFPTACHGPTKAHRRLKLSCPSVPSRNHSCPHLYAH